MITFFILRFLASRAEDMESLDKSTLAGLTGVLLLNRKQTKLTEDCEDCLYGILINIKFALTSNFYKSTPLQGQWVEVVKVFWAGSPLVCL